MDGGWSTPSALLSTSHSLAQYCRSAFVSTGWSFPVSPSPARVTSPEGNGRSARPACSDVSVERWHHPGTPFARGSIRPITRPIAETACFLGRTAGFHPISHSTRYFEETPRSCWVVCLIWLSSQSFWACGPFGSPCPPLTKCLRSIFHGSASSWKTVWLSPCSSPFLQDPLSKIVPSCAFRSAATYTVSPVPSWGVFLSPARCRAAYRYWCPTGRRCSSSAAPSATSSGCPSGRLLGFDWCS